MDVLSVAQFLPGSVAPIAFPGARRTIWCYELCHCTLVERLLPADSNGIVLLKLIYGGTQERELQYESEVRVKSGIQLLWFHKCATGRASAPICAKQTIRTVEDCQVVIYTCIVKTLVMSKTTFSHLWSSWLKVGGMRKTYKHWDNDDEGGLVDKQVRCKVPESSITDRQSCLKKKNLLTAILIWCA